VATAGRMTGRFEHFDARPGGSYRLVRADAPTLVRAGKSAVDSHVVGRQGRPVDGRSRVDIRADDVRDGINAADHAAGLSSSLDNLAASVERRLPRSHGARRLATIRVVATEGQIYGRQLQQAGDYTGPHRDPLAGHRDRSPTGCRRTEMLPADSRSGRDVAAEPRAAAHYRFAREATARRWARRKNLLGWSVGALIRRSRRKRRPIFLLFDPSWTRAASLRHVERGPSWHRPELEPFNTG
jgi:hypothetical protein